MPAAALSVASPVVRPRGQKVPTDLELEILVAVEAHWRAYEEAPTGADLERFLGMAIRWHLRLLRKRGLLVSGTLRITGPACWYVYPVPGRPAQ